MRIAVLVGGASAERDVSFATGSAIFRALRANGHDVVAIDTGEGRVIDSREGEKEEGEGGEEGGQLELAAEVGTAPPEVGALPGDRAGALGSVPLLNETELVFVALHGGAGEDGRLQALLDLVGIPYTGSGHLGSALAMDKLVSKELMVRAGIATPPWLVAPVDGRALEDELGGFPVVVKPSREGSTVGVTLVRAPDELGAAIERAAGFAGDVLVEKFIPGRELAVGVLGSQALPIVEILPSHELYDYECKYTRGRTEYRVPAELSAEVTGRVQSAAEDVHETLRLSAYSRIDFRLDEAGLPWCLEANSLPGMTETSLLPKAAEAAGITFNELCERIAKLALELE